MKIREYFKAFFTNVKDGISRYCIAFICTVLLFLTVSYEILFESGTDEIVIPLVMTFSFIALFSVLLKSVQEYLFEKLNILIQAIVCTLASIAGFFLIHTHYESLYMIMAYSGIMIALICFIFFVLMRGENRDMVFPKLVSSAIFAFAICDVLSVGLSTCIWAFQSLIFNFTDSYKIYVIVNLLIWTIGYINIFLSFIPKKDVPTPQSKIFRIFVLFAGLPLYILLIAILLIYLAKIVVTWNMPIGEINWFASFASLFFIFFVLSVTQYKEKFAKLFVKYGGYFLIPVLVMQAIAVFERINAYGLTTPRTVSLVLILISILFIAGAIIKPKYFNTIALASGIIVLVVTVTPLNVIDMPVASQTAILENALVKNDMLKDGVVIPKENVSKDDAEIIISAYDYLKHNAKQVPEFIPDSEKSFLQIFGFEWAQFETEYNYQHCTFKTKDSVDISGYHQMLRLHGYNDILSFEHNATSYEINIIEVAQALYDQYGTDQYELELYKVNENMALYIEFLYTDIEDDLVTNTSFDGYALIKN
ncbi:MAG: DUF4153 domain-containing protein [Clostridia bacterium]|nr:DUF4153 domain-containing protein [Clostridia bacterium]